VKDLHRQVDPAPRRRKFQRIVQKIRDHAKKHVAVGFDDQAGGRVIDDPDGFLCQRLLGCDHVREKRSQVEFSDVQSQLARFQSGDLQQGGDEAGHAFRAVLGQGDDAIEGFRVLDLIPQRFQQIQ